jgi:peptidyl-prolyl cis-trans isomerase-like 2
MAPFSNPVLLGQTSGVIFDFENIVEYVKQHKKDPVTGDEVTLKDIIRLNMEKNADGQWHWYANPFCRVCSYFTSFIMHFCSQKCSPVTNKVFTSSSHMVAIATSGNVYAFNAVNELNIKAKNFTDLISGEPFKKSDIITLQDPQNAEHTARRDISNFMHLKTVRQESSDNRKSESKVRQSLSGSNVMKEIEMQRQQEKESGVKRKTLEEIVALGSSSEDTTDVARFMALNGLTGDVTPGLVSTDGKASSSLTSTSSNVWTGNATRRATAEEVREARWKIMRKVEDLNVNPASLLYSLFAL